VLIVERTNDFGIRTGSSQGSLENGNGKKVP
jgi:hypothetical protein